ncbi:MAG: ATP-dependent RecD-like DNA helicase [Actinobacteria bacterium]|nr:ATP-dependent RecD-like DNA helicase [Actinomycetota bacterium]
MGEKKQKIRGTLQRIVFRNQENNFVVAKLKTCDDESVTIVGSMPEVNLGEELEAEGKWVFNERYGEQFEIESIQVLVPTTLDGIEKFLGSGMIKGIGPVMAKKIVSHFGLETLKILDESCERLSEIEGFADKRIEMIREGWQKYRDMRETMIFLQSCGIGSIQALKIYSKYGKDTLNIVKTNPYRLGEDIFGIGFKTADKIASNMGIQKDSIFRIKSAILYLLTRAEEEGHCYFPYQEFLENASDFLEVSDGKISAALEELEKENKVCITDGDLRKVYLKDIYEDEKHVCSKLSLISKSKSRYSCEMKNTQERLTEIISQVVAESEIEPDSVQMEALRKAFEEKVLIITGSPGTGKSTLLNLIIKIFEKENKKVILAAPTGRASKRMSEITGREAKTIHRLLEYNPKLNKFLRNKTNPLSADVVIVDEVSMLDIRLARSLLEAIDPESRLILVGDVDQLPSVGPGNFLRDLINSVLFPVVRLKKIYRQEGKSLIIYNAHRVRDGLFPYVGKSETRDFFFIEKNDYEEIVKLILDLIARRIPNTLKCDPFSDIQVLVPTNKGIVGANNLNFRIQEALNPSSLKICIGLKEFRLNDKVIQLKNNYEKEVYNGDIGFIRHIDPEMQELVVDFDSRVVSYNFYELDELGLSYAISIHKSQGSEFNCVIVPILTSHYMLLHRNLLYTALTRAKRLAILIGSKKAVGMAIKRADVENRYTSLEELLRSTVD